MFLEDMERSATYGHGVWPSEPFGERLFWPALPGWIQEHGKIEFNIWYLPKCMSDSFGWSDAQIQEVESSQLVHVLYEWWCDSLRDVPIYCSTLWQCSSWVLTTHRPNCWLLVYQFILLSQVAATIACYCTINSHVRMHCHVQAASSLSSWQII